MARYTSDFLGVWSQFVDVALTSGAGGAVPRPNGAAPAAAGAARTTIAVRVDAARPVTVTVDVEAAFLSRTLTVQEVRSGDPTKPPLGSVRLEPATPTAPARLHVAIPAAQPAGAYTGVVVDEATGRFAGTVGITIDGEGTR